MARISADYRESATQIKTPECNLWYSNTQKYGVVTMATVIPGLQLVKSAKLKVISDSKQTQLH